MEKKSKKPVVAICMGSDSDLSVMKEAKAALQKLGVSSSFHILSAHRTPHDVATFSETARKKGYQVIIAGAGGAAHLPGMVAAYTDLPVIGVPVPIGPLKGDDAFLSIVQMPTGVPVACVAIGNAWNAGVLAAQIASLKNKNIAKKLNSYKLELKKKVYHSRKKIKT